MDVKAPGPLTLKVTMLGGRRAGKSTALLAMAKCFEEKFKDTKLRVNPTGGTKKTIKDRSSDFNFSTNSNRLISPDEKPNLTHVEYTFDVVLTGEPNASPIKLEFFDYPGEWLYDGDAQHEKMLTQHIHDSDVLIVMIDTPYLMEEKGRFNEVRNRCLEIKMAIEDNWNHVTAGIPKMVLFVPIKCEGYRDKSKMPEVLDKITHEPGGCYNQLIHRLAGRCEVAITPIQTLGTVVFKFFSFYRKDTPDEETGEIHKRGEMIMMVEKDGKKLPRYPMFCFNPARAKVAAQRQNTGTTYAIQPEDCEQLAVYTLFYALSMAALAAEYKAEAIKKKGFWERLQDSLLRHGGGILLKTVPPSFWDAMGRGGALFKAILENVVNELQERYVFTSADAFLKQRSLLSQKMKRDVDSYQILSDILGWK